MGNDVELLVPDGVEHVIGDLLGGEPRRQELAKCLLHRLLLRAPRLLGGVVPQFGEAIPVRVRDSRVHIRGAEHRDLQLTAGQRQFVVQRFR